jgi:hypothetical protein
VALASVQKHKKVTPEAAALAESGGPLAFHGPGMDGGEEGEAWRVPDAQNVRLPAPGRFRWTGGGAPGSRGGLRGGVAAGDDCGPVATGGARLAFLVQVGRVAGHSRHRDRLAGLGVPPRGYRPRWRPGEAARARGRVACGVAAGGACERFPASLRGGKRQRGKAMPPEWSRRPKRGCSLSRGMGRGASKFFGSVKAF